LRPFSRYVVLLVEESLKVLWVVALLRRGRIGFLVDGAILGFAVGAGFALVENVEYLLELAEPRVVMWLVRGLGTAVLHGATTAILAILAKALTERHPERPATALVPAFLAAVFVHSLYNHFLLPPVPAATVLLVMLPLLLVTVFERRAKDTLLLGTGFDIDFDLVDAIVSG
jgi:RsiW-degrading membrane proteinase PrsW (M82 family)